MGKIRYLIFGKNGQLGKEFLNQLERQSQVEVLGVGREECDISNLFQVLDVFNSFKPDVVINCAAYNLVDKAEEDYINAIRVNGLGVRNLAFASSNYKSFLVHYSTDYVFDGRKRGALYVEDDVPNPVNEYGKSKLLGEEFVKEEMDNFLLFRVSWVYGNGKQNFIYKLLSWLREKEYIMVSFDEVSVPTSVRIIVDLTLKSLNEGLKGVYHLTNSGYASRYEWAKKILEVKKIRKVLYPVSSEIFNLPARRPEFSAMSNVKISKALNVEIPSWEEELKRYLQSNW